MSISENFSTSLGDNTQWSNKELAQKIVAGKDHKAIDELINIISSSTTKTLADALKVLEMIAESDAKLLPDLWSVIFPLLTHKDNKICWRAMCVLSPMAHRYQSQVFENLSSFLKIMDAGSVITRDHGVKLLVAAYENENFSEILAPIITEQILSAPDNQVGQYAEKWMTVIHSGHIPDLIHVLEIRQKDFTSDSHQNRIARVLSKLHKKK